MQREQYNDFASRYDHSQNVHENSMSTIAPVYAQNAFNNPARNALIPSTVADEAVVEHEHHHVHHHIDHGNVNNMSLARRSERNFAQDGFEEDRRYTSSVSVIHHDHHGHDHHGHQHHHRRRSGDRSSQRFSRSDIDLSASGSRRGSVQLSGTSDWTIIDVPPGTRRITIDTTAQAPQQEEEISWSRYNGVRRSRGLSTELWTEITKDLVTREAIEDMGFQYEETDHFYYIFEYLNKEQVGDLVKLTKDIRRERARELEYNSIAGSAREHKYHNTTRLIEPPQYQRPAYTDDHPEIVYTEEQTRRRSRKYYY